MDNGKIGSLSTEDIQYIHTQYQKRMDTGTTIEEKGVIICLDVLGWKNYTRPNQIENLTALTAGLETTILSEFLKLTDNSKNNKIDIVNFEVNPKV